jgi:hypothetical protein
MQSRNAKSSKAFSILGAAAFAGVALVLIPVPVLFGLFLLLGVMGLVGIQFVHRLKLLFIPQKYFPNFPYCKKVSRERSACFACTAGAGLKFENDFCFALIAVSAACSRNIANVYEMHFIATATCIYKVQSSAACSMQHCRSMLH